MYNTKTFACRPSVYSINLNRLSSARKIKVLTRLRAEAHSDQRLYGSKATKEGFLAALLIYSVKFVT